MFVPLFAVSPTRATSLSLKGNFFLALAHLPSVKGKISHLLVSYCLFRVQKLIGKIVRLHHEPARIKRT